ncbi:hypothetical protein [Streptomyces chrestomyceticus]|uniref:hypothetical protein n=1 Tax=Streptomyces chrestomyceticus TaxID=68185 RepID=UPI0019D2F376|nr:hypothetical protein [Streptomyces chrestomyceticus]
MHALSAGSQAGPYVLGVVALVVVLALLVAWAIRAVLKKARAQDVPAVLCGLSQAIGALSCLLPWGKWRYFPGETLNPPALPGQNPAPGTAASPTISISTNQLAVVRPAMPTVTTRPPASAPGAFDYRADPVGPGAEAQHVGTAERALGARFIGELSTALKTCRRP